MLASGCGGGAVKLWDVATGQELRTLSGLKSPVKSVAFSPDGRMLASASGSGTINDAINDTARLWDVATGRGRPAVAPGGSGLDGVDAVAFSPDGSVFVTADDYPPDGSIKLWDAATGQYIRSVFAQAGVVIAVAFGGDGHTMAAVTRGGSVTQWDAATGGELRTFSIGGADTIVRMSFAFSPDGHTIATGSGRGDVQLWDVATGHKLSTLPNDAGAVCSIAFSPDGRTLASGINSRIAIWDIATGQEIRILRGHTQHVYALAFSPDGRTLASGSYDKTIKIWDVATGQMVRTLGTPSPIIASASIF